MANGYTDPLTALLAPRMGLKALADLSLRLSHSLEAGIDVRTVWAREAERASGYTRAVMQRISERVNRGESLTDALQQSGNFFPPLFRGVAEVGEESGHQGETFAALAAHYREQLALRRAFLSAISWPIVQLCLAILVIGLLIVIMGWINQSGGVKVDPLGFGLIGARGLMVYLSVLCGAGLAIGVFLQLMRRGVFWLRPVQRAMLFVPGLGSALRTLALARIAWSLNLTLRAGMEIRKAVRLSLSTAQNAYYLGHIPTIDRAIACGRSLYEAFSESGGYPRDFLDMLAAGEQSGRIEESMAVLSRQYEERGRAAVAMLTMLAGVVVWMLVASVIIFMIFRLFSFYVNAINSAAAPL